MKYPRWVYRLLNIHSPVAHAHPGYICPACKADDDFWQEENDDQQ